MPSGLLYLVVGDRDLNRFSYVWRIWSHGTSFYLKPRLDVLSAFKISLHGLDPTKGQPGYKFEVERSGPGGPALRFSDGWPDKGWFTGQRVAPDVDLVLRFRFPWDLFTSSRPSAPMPEAPRRRSIARMARLPSPMRAVDVDVLVCRGEPYWPDEEKARADNACLGPLKNKAGQSLTAVAVHRSPFTHPAPSSPVEARALGTDAVRGLRASADSRGFVWIEEQFISRSWLTDDG